MKTFNKRLTAVFLSLIMLFTATVPSFAGTADGWASYWLTDEAQAGIIMFPGADDSSRNFNWYSDEETTPEVLVSLSHVMSDATSFKGYAVKTYSGNYANKVTVSGLEGGKTYYYQCISGDFASQVYSFETDAKPIIISASAAILHHRFTALKLMPIHLSPQCT